MGDGMSEGRAAIHAVIQEQAELVVATGGGFLSEWVVVANFVNLEGESFIARLGSENLLVHARHGLLYVGLYGMDDFDG